MQVQKEFFIVERNWGKFLQFTENEISTVKLLHIKKGESISYQYHNKRSEMWYCISGWCWATKDIEQGVLSHALKPGEVFTIPAKSRHMLEGLEDSTILEISFGLFDENDIVRLPNPKQ